ncbi:conserved hypothetical protein [Roseibium sp. TrichSKD4]|nr:conserved hypothetical protein [Roseibium sp. TrichSKD4]
MVFTTLRFASTNWRHPSQLRTYSLKPFGGSKSLIALTGIFLEDANAITSCDKLG